MAHTFALYILVKDAHGSDSVKRSTIDIFDGEPNIKQMMCALKVDGFVFLSFPCVLCARCVLSAEYGRRSQCSYAWAVEASELPNRHTTHEVNYSASCMTNQNESRSFNIYRSSMDVWGVGCGYAYRVRRIAAYNMCIRLDVVLHSAVHFRCILSVSAVTACAHRAYKTT